jgi:hypothetical protein
MFDQTPIKASVEINKFIRHTITNLEGALEHQDDKLTLAVLTNLADTIESYIEPLELSVFSDTLWGQEK